MTKYGPDCWLLIYQADVRMRGEHFERLRRKLQINFGPVSSSLDSTPRSPGTLSSQPPSKIGTFWDSEIREKALLYLAKVSTYKEASDDGTSQISYSRGHTSSVYPQSNSQGQKRKPLRSEPSQGLSHIHI